MVMLQRMVVIDMFSFNDPIRHVGTSIANLYNTSTTLHYILYLVQLTIWNGTML